MKRQDFIRLATTLLLAFSLAACTNKSTETLPEQEVESRQIIAKHSDTRLNFNKIVLASADKDFKGGTNLATLKELFGEPQSHKKVPAGDVELDAYHWQFDALEINVQLYEDSAIVRSLSHFAFIRQETNGLKEYEQLKEGMTYTQAVDLLGEPDVFSQAVSSDKEQLQALWSSGLRSDGQGQIELLFENNKLKDFHQFNLVD